jgi:hypothetical protein
MRFKTYSAVPSRMKAIQKPNSFRRCFFRCILIASKFSNSLLLRGRNKIIKNQTAPIVKKIFQKVVIMKIHQYKYQILTKAGGIVKEIIKIMPAINAYI